MPLTYKCRISFVALSIKRLSEPDPQLGGLSLDQFRDLGCRMRCVFSNRAISYRYFEAHGIAAREDSPIEVWSSYPPESFLRGQKPMTRSSVLLPLPAPPISSIRSPRRISRSGRESHLEAQIRIGNQCSLNDLAEAQSSRCSMQSEKWLSNKVKDIASFAPYAVEPTS